MFDDTSSKLFKTSSFFPPKYGLLSSALLAISESSIMKKKLQIGFLNLVLPMGFLVMSYMHQMFQFFVYEILGSHKETLRHFQNCMTNQRLFYQEIELFGHKYTFQKLLTDQVICSLIEIYLSLNDYPFYEKVSHLLI